MQTAPAQARPSRPPMKGYIREYGWAYLFILAPVLLFLIFTLYPVASAFLMSFQEYSVMGSEWIGADNYTRMVQDEVFWKSMRNTVIFTIGTVPVNIVITYALSFLFFR